MQRTLPVGLLLLFMFVNTALTTEFIPMSPISAECIPVMLEVSGDAEWCDIVQEQLTSDIDFSGLLITSEEGYVEVSVEVNSVVDGITIRAEVISGGEYLMSRSYTGTSVYALVHAFADDLVCDLTGEQGIASTYIAFIRRSSSGYALCTKSIDPRQARNLMTDSEVITTPAWSPGGDRIVFTSYRYGSGDLWMYNFQTGSAREILSLPGLNTSPSWSPDGDAIALTLSGGTNADIYLFDLSTDERTRLTLGSSIETSASFSPTGNQIIFTSDRVGYPQLYVMDSIGGTAIRITRSHGYCDSPAWSPSGDKIAYTALLQGKYHIFVMDADGSNIRQVTFEGSLNEDPVWGPTGRHLAFSSNRDGGRSIYIVELNELNVMKLSNSGESYCPTWSPVDFR